MRMSRIRLLGFGLTAVFLFFGLLEAVLRVADFPRGALYRPEPGAGWSLQPNLEASPMVHHESGRTFHVSTDRNGLRRTPPSTHPPPGCQPYRILLLGDSNTFGWGLENDQTWGSSLKRALEDRGVEVINGGMPGYTLVQCFELFRHVAGLYRPDMVILSVGMHDVAPMPGSPLRKGPGSAAMKTRRSLLAHSRLARLVRMLLVAPGHRTAAEMSAPDSSGPGRTTAARPPKVSAREFERVLLEFCDLGDREGFVVVTAPIPGINDSPYRSIMTKLAAAGRLVHIDIRPNRRYERLPGDPNHLGVEGAARFGQDLASALSSHLPPPCTSE